MYALNYEIQRMESRNGHTEVVPVVSLKPFYTPTRNEPKTPMNKEILAVIKPTAKGINTVEADHAPKQLTSANSRRILNAAGEKEKEKEKEKKKKKEKEKKGEGRKRRIQQTHPNHPRIIGQYGTVVHRDVLIYYKHCC